MKPSNESEQLSLRDIYLRALDKQSLEAREAYLEGACGDNLSLRNKVEALLRENAEDSFLESPALAETEILTETVIESPGTMVGRYKILQRIGEGGMGAVYMAEQTEPVTRKVALKIIKLGMDTKQVVARFEAERQALAMMDHPNIAKVLDAGATDNGRPYFVMELVRGVPITEYCDKNKLSAKERLELFIPVCQAIQHAHHKGIIHRDVKPSNVMVTLHDGHPVPKVIDFGIAKATNQKLTEKTLFTNYAQMIGTPAYMSPEQAEMSGLDVDTRTDVYSLGVLLYELLTGTTPFPAKELLSMGYGEMQRVISETEPPKPSTRMSTMQHEERTSIAKNRSIDASGLDAAFRGDLDWIVMKSLEKDRTQRYETVNGLAADVQRHLNNEPVTAAAPTFGYQLKKFYRRNRGYMRAAAMVVGLLAIVSAFATFQAIRANRLTLKTQEALDQVKLEQEKTIRESIRGDVFVDHMLKSLDKDLTALFGAGKHASMIELLEDRSRLCKETLSNNPADELKVRLAICQYFRSCLKDFPRALKQAERMKLLLPKVAESESEQTLHNYQVEILATRMWAASPHKDADPITDELRDLESFLRNLQETQGADPAAKIKSAAHLGGYYQKYALFDKSREFFQIAVAMQPRKEDTVKNPYLWFSIFNAQSNGASLEDLTEQLPLFKTPAPSASLLGKFFYIHQLSRHWKYLFMAGKRNEAEVLLVQARAQSREVGNESLSNLLRVMHARFLLLAGDPQAALELVEGVEISQEFSYQIWQDLFGLLARTDAKKRYEKMRIIGLSRFASDVDYYYGKAFIWNSLCHPAPQDLVEIYGEIAQRITSTRHQWASSGEHFYTSILILHAYRAKDYQRAIELIKSYVPNPFDEDYETVPSETWGMRMVWAMSLARLDQSEDALIMYEEAVKIREMVYANQPLETRQILDLFMREAQQTLAECGIAVPEGAEL